MRLNLVSFMTVCTDYPCVWWDILNEANSLQTSSIRISTTHLWTRWSKPWNRAVRLARSKRKVPLENVKSLLRFSAR